MFRGAARVYRHSFRMVSSQAERRNCTIYGQPRGNHLHARFLSGNSQKTEINVYSRHPTVPHFCVPRGDAAIAACQARVHGALNSTQFRDKSLCSLVDLGLNRSRPMTCKILSKRQKKTYKKTKNVSRNRPVEATRSYFAPLCKGIGLGFRFRV